MTSTKPFSTPSKMEETPIFTTLGNYSGNATTENITSTTWTMVLTSINPNNYSQNNLNSTANQSLFTEATRQPEMFDRDIIRYTRFYLTGIIIFPGIILNILALVVFAVSRMRHSTSGQYLLALTIFDSFVLIGEMLQWLNEVIGENYRPILGITFRDTNDFGCQFITFLRYFGRLLSAWTTIIITGERFIMINFPLKVAFISTKKTANIIIVTETVIGAGLAVFPFYTMGVAMFGYCAITKRTVYNVFMWIVVYVGDLILPSILVCFLTGLIVVTLFRVKATRKSQAEGQKVKSDREFQLTVTLIFISIAFVVLRLPYCIAFFMHMNRNVIFSDLSEYTDYALWAARDITAAIAIMNNMINFFLYAMCGSVFRSEFKRVFCCIDEKTMRKNKTIMTYANGSLTVNSTHGRRSQEETSAGGQQNQNSVNRKNARRGPCGH